MCTACITYPLYAEAQFCLSACCIYPSDWTVLSIDFILLFFSENPANHANVIFISVSSQNINYCGSTPYDTELHILNS